jgi:hypothetical protein
MKKLVASVLAGVAAQAAVLAIFELAKGFAALFFNPAEAAAHFKAAALFGVVALGAGLAGRAIAGDSFQRQSGAANSASVGSSGGGGGGSSSSNQGEVYSGQKEIIMGGSWMKSGQREPVQVIEFRVPRGWLADSMKRDIETNGPTRLLIRDVATDS